MKDKIESVSNKMKIYRWSVHEPQENSPELMVLSFQIESPTKYPTQRMRNFKFQDARWKEKNVSLPGRNCRLQGVGIQNGKILYIPTGS